MFWNNGAGMVTELGALTTELLVYGFMDRSSCYFCIVVAGKYTLLYISTLKRALLGMCWEHLCQKNYSFSFGLLLGRRALVERDLPSTL